MSSSLKDKDAALHFIIDNTPPQIVMDGIEAGGIYDASQKKVNVMFSDNGKLTEARLSLHNDKGEEINSWDYMELAAAENPLMLEIEEYGGGQRFLYLAKKYRNSLWYCGSRSRSVWRGGRFILSQKKERAVCLK